MRTAAPAAPTSSAPSARPRALRACRREAWYQHLPSPLCLFVFLQASRPNHTSARASPSSMFYLAHAARRVRCFSTIASVSVLDAARMVEAGSHYLDCRAESEFVDAAVAASSVENVSFPHNDGGGVTNEAFLAECANAFDRSDSIVVVRRVLLSPARSRRVLSLTRASRTRSSALLHRLLARVLFCTRIGLQERSTLAHGGTGAGGRRLH